MAEDKPQVEYDRRAKSGTGFMRHILETFSGKQGRKAAFAIWGFWVGTGLLTKDKITPEIWWHVFLTCALLIGFGTILDSVVAKFGDAAVSVFTDKISKFKSTLTVTKEVSTSVDATTQQP